MSGHSVGVFGASSFVGRNLLHRLSAEGLRVLAFSRTHAGVAGDFLWRKLPASPEPVAYWVSAAPIWVLPGYFPFFEACGARRIVVLSSTSCFTKADSVDEQEQRVAARLADSEERLRRWAESRGVEWVVLRPTLIYGEGRDRNVSDIARFIRRFGCFPVLGRAAGMRQPVHVDDVARACVSALAAPAASNRAYNISGGEVLSYRTMVERVFAALGCRPRIIAVPLWGFRLALRLARVWPRLRHLTPSMAVRMNSDHVFEHGDAARDFGFSPRPFRLDGVEVGSLTDQ